MSAGGGLRLLVARSLRRHALSSAVTALSIALATGLVLAVFALQAQSERAFTGGSEGFDAVLGARGSALQLVLNGVFHLETSPGNLSWETYEKVARVPGVERAIPYAVGDSFRGHRVVGTVPGRFEGSELRTRGRLFRPDAREAVVGSLVARQTGLTVGSRFRPHHGLVEGDEAHEHGFEVVGVLETSNTPADRVIWIPLEAVYRMDGHVLRGAGAVYRPEDGSVIPDEHKEVSAVLLTFGSPQTGFLLDQHINKRGREATLAWPIGSVMADLFDKLGWLHRVLLLVAYLVVVVAAGSVLASLYNTMNERRRELAILRALGAGRRTVFAAVVLEAAAIGAAGTAGGLVVYAAIFALAREIVRGQTGVVLELGAYHPVFVWGPLAMVALAALAGVIPARKAYTTDVAAHLVQHS